MPHSVGRLRAPGAQIDEFVRQKNFLCFQWRAQAARQAFASFYPAASGIISWLRAKKLGK
jgi:hypothetical protein